MRERLKRLEGKRIDDPSVASNWTEEHRYAIDHDPTARSLFEQADRIWNRAVRDYRVIAGADALLACDRLPYEAAVLQHMSNEDLEAMHRTLEQFMARVTELSDTEVRR